ncbi:MAG: hypothetical protein H6618_09135 [Deltaproteobacteria bacterium]|nr:hypothetical protein [Deltaproteobacteria bacterium]
MKEIDLVGEEIRQQLNLEKQEKKERKAITTEEEREQPKKPEDITKQEQARQAQQAQQAKKAKKAKKAQQERALCKLLNDLIQFEPSNARIVGDRLKRWDSPFNEEKIKGFSNSQASTKNYADLSLQEAEFEWIAHQAFWMLPLLTQSTRVRRQYLTEYGYTDQSTKSTWQNYSGYAILVHDGRPYVGFIHIAKGANHNSNEIWQHAYFQKASEKQASDNILAKDQKNLWKSLPQDILSDLTQNTTKSSISLQRAKAHSGEENHHAVHIDKKDNIHLLFSRPNDRLILLPLPQHRHQGT